MARERKTLDIDADYRGVHYQGRFVAGKDRGFYGPNGERLPRRAAQKLAGEPLGWRWAVDGRGVRTHVLGKKDGTSTLTNLQPLVTELKRFHESERVVIFFQGQFEHDSTFTEKHEQTWTAKVLTKAVWLSKIEQLRHELPKPTLVDLANAAVSGDVGYVSRVSQIAVSKVKGG